MSEPSDEEMERAERIRELRSGGTRSRGHERRERRRSSRDDAMPGEDARSPDDAGPGEEGSAPGEGGAETAADADDPDGTGDVPGPLPGSREVDVLSMAEALPEDGSLFVVPVREGLRRQFNTVAEQLHLRYGFEYGGDLDADQHVRPMALYLGVRALEDCDVEDVKDLLESVDELVAPESGPETTSE